MKYRIPEKNKVSEIGRFVSFENTELDQFVVFPFSGKEAYSFRKDDSLQGMINYKDLPEDLDKSSYVSKASDFKIKLIEKELSKAIFSRTKILKKEVDVIAFFDALCEAYPSAFVYLISSELFGTWIGASPEVLFKSENGIGETVALAGTMKATDRGRWGEKEREEQQFVTDFIKDKLKSKVQKLSVEEARESIAGPVKHLKSTFSFSIEAAEALDVALSLHPTPAVSGLPQKESIELINEIETYDRRLYTGFLGVIGKRTELYVNLRCAQVGESALCLYLGGGFTKDSNVELEWEETENKSETLLKVLEKL
ncbi:MAG: chorismate-binding protein [Crocinitomicaceae bacterium]|nr:chorismate-binding protein [Crocinitomicaceae bacterium]